MILYRNTKFYATVGDKQLRMLHKVGIFQLKTSLGTLSTFLGERLMKLALSVFGTELFLKGWTDFDEIFLWVQVNLRMVYKYNIRLATKCKLHSRSLQPWLRPLIRVSIRVDSPYDWQYFFVWKIIDEIFCNNFILQRNEQFR